MNKKELLLVTPVWGKIYIDNFCFFCLRSLFADKNIPALSVNKRLIFFIYTTSEDERYFKEKTEYELLIKYADVKFIYLEDNSLLDGSMYAQMTNCHNHSLVRARQMSVEYVLFVMPDQLFSNGSFSYIEEVMDAGNNLFLTTSLRLDLSKMKEYLSELNQHHVISLTDIELNNLAKKAVHDIFHSVCWSSECLSDFPSNIVFPFDDKLVVHGFHLHPMALRPGIVLEPSRTTIDDDYITGFLQDYEKVIINSSSEKYCSHDITHSRNAMVNSVRTLEKALKVSYWAHTWTSAFHRQIFKQPILFRFSSESIYKGETSELVDKILRQIDWFEGSTEYLEDVTFECRHSSEVFQNMVSNLKSENVDGYLLDLDKKLDAASVVALWGVGASGRYVEQLMNSYGIEVRFYADTYFKGEKRGKKVINDIDGLLEAGVDFAVVSCGMPEYLDDMLKIRQSIEDAGITVLFSTKTGAWVKEFSNRGIDECLISLVYSRYVSIGRKKLFLGEFCLSSLFYLDRQMDFQI